MIDEASKEWLKEESDMVRTSLNERLQDAIDGAAPVLTGRQDIYREALRLVAGCEDISQVVSLVNWLISLSLERGGALKEIYGIQ